MEYSQRISLRRAAPALLVLLLLVKLCLAQADTPDSNNPIDPIVNFCSRFQHQSTLKNDVLYIDGGIHTYRLGGLNYTQNGTAVPSQVGINNMLLTVGMNESWNWWTNITQTALTKDVNPVADYTPDRGVIRGAMFSGMVSDNKIYTFGGTTFMGNQSFPGWQPLQSDANPLWSYDPVEREWTPYASSIEERPNYGSWAEATDKGIGFYLNGQIDNGSYYNTRWLENNTHNLPGMIVLFLNNQTMHNISTPGLPSSYPRVGGNLQYIPDAGNDGILVSLGGAYRESGGVGSFTEQKLATFDQVDVFDLDSFLKDPKKNGTWYSQRTTGDIPPPMIDSCVVANYLYGGRDPTDPNIKLYDGIWALSLPSFTWTHIIGGDSPRWGHTCHIARTGQIITVGGSLNRTYDGCDWELRGVAIFDLSTKLWGTVFRYDDVEYWVTQNILTRIGGGYHGGATMTAPAGGYNTAALESVMSVTLPNQPGPRNSKRPGVIAGAVVGAVVGVSLIAGIVLLLRYRRIKKSTRDGEAVELADGTSAELSGDKKTNEAPADPAKFELPADKLPAELPDQTAVAYEMPAEENEIKAKKAVHEHDERVEMTPEQERDFPNWEELRDVKVKPKEARDLER